MSKSLNNKRLLSLTVLSLALCSMTLAATPFDAQARDTGAPNDEVAGYTGDPAMTGVDPGQIEPFATEELVDLVAPVALYPDDLLAIVLPAAAYPLQIVLAARFLEALNNDDSLQPDEAWDESVVALLNYPEVIDLLNGDLDWTWQLGEAVINQESEVIEAIETFRDRAMLAGNLETDERQIVDNEDGVITITPVEREVIYVPYYEPERVVVYQPYPVYHYYPRPYPVYYYPYPVDHYFHSGFFWGITTAFAIGWHSQHLNIHLSNYYSHPYYGHTYFRSHHYYHAPSHHDTRRLQAGSGGHDGDRWRPGRRHGGRPSERGPGNDLHLNNTVVAAAGVSRFQRSDTFRPRPGSERRMISASNTSTGQADRSMGDRPPALARDARGPSRRDRNREYHVTPKMDRISHNRKTTAKAKRNRLDVEPERRVSNARPVAQNQSSGKRVTPSAKAKRNRLDWERDRRTPNSESIAQNQSSRKRANRTVKSPGRISKPAVPSNQNRLVSRSDRSRPIQTNRANPAAGIRLPQRVTNTLAYAGGPESRPSPQPRQSQRPVSRSPERRQAPAVNKPSPQHRSDRGRSNSHGDRGQSHRDRRVGRQ